MVVGACHRVITDIVSRSYLDSSSLPWSHSTMLLAASLSVVDATVLTLPVEYLEGGMSKRGYWEPKSC